MCVVDIEHLLEGGGMFSGDIVERHLGEVFWDGRDGVSPAASGPGRDRGQEGTDPGLA